MASTGAGTRLAIQNARSASPVHTAPPIALKSKLKGGQMFVIFDFLLSVRAWEAMFEYILLSGGSGYMFGQEPSEAIEIEQYLIRMGVPKNCILTEHQSRNTYENAVYSKKLIEQTFESAPSILLITSAFHMPRTKACFEKQKPFKRFSITVYWWWRSNGNCG